MKYLLIATLAAVVGAIAGSLASGYLTQAHAAGTDLQTKGIVLLDERNSPAARLGFVGGSTVLQFYNSDSTVALEIGIQKTRQERFVHFFGAKGQLLAALNSRGNGDTALSLGSRQWAGRVVLGAITTSDVPLMEGEPTTEWGLLFSKPRSSEQLFDLHIDSSKDLQKSWANMEFKLENGAKWTAH